MSTSTSVLPNHRHTRSAAFEPPAAAAQNPHSPHHLNQHSYNTNSQSSMVYPPQPTTPPRTPQKPEHNSSAKNGNGTDSTSKPKAKGKNRPKNVMTSPATSRNDRNTPPLTGMPSAGPTSARPISTPATAAYAGPTFHASPAPSALPIPSFYSKSVPESPGMKALKAQREREASISSNGDSPTPPTALALADQTKREESPLDFFFKADREEKARARSSSSFRESGSESGPFPPPLGSPHSAQTTPAPGSQRRSGQAHFAGGSSSAMFAMELDGNNSPGKPYGPAFSTPYTERINAARAGSSPSQSPQPTSGQQQTTDRSEALKAYLFSGQVMPAQSGADSPNFLGASPSMVSVPSGSSRNKSGSIGGPRNTGVQSRPPQNGYSFINGSGPSQDSPRGNSRSSGLRQEVTPTKTPNRTPDQLARVYANPSTPSRASKTDPNSTSRDTGSTIDGNRPAPSFPIQTPDASGGAATADLKGMEESLRRILKLEPLGNVSSQSPLNNMNGVFH